MDAIRAEIAAHGPIPFERFMEVALYGADGFFMAGGLRSVQSGDFLTSPEVSRLFGETLARFVAEEKSRVGEPFCLVEVGAGSGSLLAPLLDVVNVPAWAVEVSPAARAALTATLPEERIVASLAQVPGPFAGVIIANELIDNLPMAIAQYTDQGWRERWVGAEDGALTFVDAPVRSEVAEWLNRFAGPVEVGGWVEVQLAAGQWVREALGLLTQGALAVIDYGDLAENLAPRRRDGTLRTYRSHHLGPHPLDEPGATDITADVNFSALLWAAVEAGATASLHRQDDFLSDLGLRSRLAGLRRSELDLARSGDEMERLRVRTLVTEAETVLHPRGLGDFRVMVARK
ncbi:MAG TPA: SAM-dependent methyltransferase [Acidimicrobiia bacterium]|nr:SAM-dependent methyltransferase [Acidimicrobiia bacterium]